MTPPRQKAESAPDADPAGISTHQMREMHALLRDHGISGDKSVHDYLTVALGREIESRATLTTVEAAHVIAELEGSDVAVAHTTSGAALKKLRAPFPDEEVGKLPKSTCRDCSQAQNKRCDRHTWVSNCPACHGSHSSGTMHIDYVGHADVTARLLAVDPLWSWAPFTVEEMSALAPALRGDLWIHLTVLGVTRPGVGDGKNAKECIGDAIRNAAMRFGVALDLWAKGDRDWAKAEKTGTDQHPDTPPARQQTADPPHTEPRPKPYAGPTTEELLASIDAHAVRAGITYEQITQKFRTDHGGLSVDDLEKLSPQQLGPLEASIAAYLLEHPPGDQPN